MTKEEFLNRLGELLSAMPEEDVEGSKQFYSELIDDNIEDGKSEEEAVASLGTPEEVAKQIISEKPAANTVTDSTPTEDKAPANTARELNTAAVILIIVLFPIWIGPVSGLLSVYVSIWAVIVSFYAVGAASIIGGLGMLVLSFLAPTAAHIMLAAGSGLILAGLGVLLILLMILLTKLYIRFTVWAFRGTVRIIDKGVHK